MKRGLRYAPYLILLLLGIGLFGWLRVEQRRNEERLHESVQFGEPDWTLHLAELRRTVQAEPSPDARLEMLARQLTRYYRTHEAPLRFRVARDANGDTILRLNAALIVPRWYSARAARVAYQEARRALGREVRVHIYETYIVGAPRFIGICRERDGVVEVAMR